MVWQGIVFEEGKHVEDLPKKLGLKAFLVRAKVSPFSKPSIAFSKGKDDALADDTKIWFAAKGTTFHTLEACSKAKSLTEGTYKDRETRQICKRCKGTQ